MIETFNELLKTIEYSGRHYDLAVIDKAYKMAERGHKNQKRNSGEPFVTHPLNVAEILIDLGMDTESIVAAILHDLVEDTDYTLDDVSNVFGNDIALLVDGVTKLGKIPFSSIEEQQAENLRKMLLAMSKDIRVMIIKLSDRLHNMRTLDGLREQKRRDKALETMEVFAPIAHRLGMSAIKEELEDLSLKYLDPVGYNEIVDGLKNNDKNGTFVEMIADDITIRLQNLKIPNFKIESRVKSIYGVYRKTYIQNRSMEEVYDIYAVRIILDTVADCYNVLGVIHDMYRPFPNRFKDYISTPKPNMYRSLHTTVIGRGTIPFEIQIRTYEMHYEAEYGIAAHWKYKVGISGKDKLEERISWVRGLLESQKTSEDATDLLSSIKSDLSPEEVYLFTPKGDVISLPFGATVIDFAYAIHSAVGNRLIGAKANGRIVPINYRVKTGEVVEAILGPKDKGPSRDWLSVVQTGEARSKIRAWFKRERRDENIEEGKDLFEKELRRNAINIPKAKEQEFLEKLVERQKLLNKEDFFAAIGYGGIQLSKILPRIREIHSKLIKSDETNPEIIRIKQPNAKSKSSDGIVVEGLEGCLVKVSKCCTPLPGDEIVGFITRGHGVSVHKADCPNVLSSKGDIENENRWVKVSWGEGVEETFKASLEIVTLNRDGVIADITALIFNMRIPIFDMKARIANERVIVNLTIGINNLEHLRSSVVKLRKIKDVESVERTAK